MTLFQGPCQGDSGGPLFVNFGDEPNRKSKLLKVLCLEDLDVEKIPLLGTQGYENHKTK